MILRSQHRQAEHEKICWIIRGDEDYGVRRSSRTLLEALRDAGYDVCLISLSNGAFADECEAAQFEVVQLGAHALPGVYHLSSLQRVRRRVAYFTQLLRYRSAVATSAAKLQPDLIHVRKTALVAYAGHAARHTGVPCLWHMPDVVDGRRALGLYRAAFQLLCVRYGIRPVGNSRYTGERFGRWPVRADVLHLGVDGGHFDPRGVEPVARSSLQIPGDAVAAAVVGRLTPSKGQHRLVEALGRVEVPANLHLVFVGGDFDRNYARQVRDAVAEGRLTHRCHFVGRVADTRPYYRVADFVINSRANAEPFGLAVIESMMMERPVLVLALGGPAETVLDGETGWHIHDASAVSWAQGIARAYADRARWVSMGQRAREWAVAEFSTERFAERYVALVTRLLEER